MTECDHARRRDRYIVEEMLEKLTLDYDFPYWDELNTVWWNPDFLKELARYISRGLHHSDG